MRASLPLLVLAALAAAPAFARAADDDGATPVAIGVGEVKDLCKAGLAHCPVSTFLCDHPAVAVVEHGPDGAVLRGVGPGTTTCAVYGHQTAFRRVLKVTVKAVGKR